MEHTLDYHKYKRIQLLEHTRYLLKMGLEETREITDIYYWLLLGEEIK